MSARYKLFTMNRYNVNVLFWLLALETNIIHNHDVDFWPMVCVKVLNLGNDNEFKTLY